MILSELKTKGAYRIELELNRDERGFFARAWCTKEFEAAGVRAAFVQANLSSTKKCGTVRGMHYQRPPSREAKLVRCIRGAIMDVIVDLRPDSKTFLDTEAVELSAENRVALYVPSGFAHGFQTLADDVEVFYEMTDFYQPELASGFRWNDQRLDIEWPLEVTSIHQRDARYPDLEVTDLECFRGLARDMENSEKQSDAPPV